MEDSPLISVVASSQSLATTTKSTVSQARSEADCPLGTLYTSVISSSYSGPAPSEVVDARSARTAFSGKLVSTSLVSPSSLLFLPSQHEHLGPSLAALKPLLSVNIFDKSGGCKLHFKPFQ